MAATPTTLKDTSSTTALASPKPPGHPCPISSAKDSRNKKDHSCTRPANHGHGLARPSPAQLQTCMNQTLCRPPIDPLVPVQTKHLAHPSRITIVPTPRCLPTQLQPSPPGKASIKPENNRNR